jgi:hypothetical protein
MSSAKQRSLGTFDMYRAKHIEILRSERVLADDITIRVDGEEWSLKNHDPSWRILFSCVLFFGVKVEDVFVRWSGDEERCEFTESAPFKFRDKHGKFDMVRDAKAREDAEKASKR